MEFLNGYKNSLEKTLKYYIAIGKQIAFKIRKGAFNYTIPEKAEDAKEELAWHQMQDNFWKELKRNNIFYYYLNKAEPYLMWIGFISFMITPMFEGTLVTLLHLLSAFTVGFGLASYYQVKRMEKTHFIRMREAIKIMEGMLDKLKAITGLNVQRPSRRAD